MRIRNPANTLCIFALALLGLVCYIDLVQADPPPPGAERDQAERDLRDSYEAERAEHQAGGDPIGQQGALVQRRIMDLQISMREYRRMIDALRAPERTGRLYAHPRLAHRGDAIGYQYLIPQLIIDTPTEELDALIDEQGPVAPMRALVSARGTDRYERGLRAAIDEARAQGRMLFWDVEPIPNGRDWSAEDRDEWLAGYELLLADARALAPDLEQAIFRVPHFSVQRETRVQFARNGNAGGTLAGRARRDQAYWSKQEMLIQEEELYRDYAQNREHFRDLDNAQDFAVVVAYQFDRYPAALWAPAEFARAAASSGGGRPMLVVLSPKEGGSRDTPWVDLAELAYLVDLVRLHDASVLWYVNGVDFDDDSPEMRERRELVFEAFGLEGSDG